MRCLRARAEKPRGVAFLMAAGVVIDADEVRLAAVVVLAGELRRFELFAVLGARDVTRGRFVRERDELADDE